MIAGLRLHIEVAGAEIQRCPRLVIRSERHTPLSAAIIQLPDVDGGTSRMLPPGSPVTVEYGYRGGETAVWKGTVNGVRRVNRDQHCLLADGLDLPLSTVCIRECYADEQASAIARHVLNHTDLPLARIEIPDDVVARFPVSNIPVWRAVRQLLHTLERANGHDMSKAALWLGSDGLNLGDLDEPGDVPIIATGENLIRHQPTQTRNGQSVVETFLLPGLAHSRLFRLEDARLDISDTYRALVVEHVIEERRMRTFINFGREYAWC